MFQFYAVSASLRSFSIALLLTVVQPESAGSFRRLNRKLYQSRLRRDDIRVSGYL